MNGTGENEIRVPIARNECRTRTEAYLGIRNHVTRYTNPQNRSGLMRIAVVVAALGLLPRLEAQVGQFFVWEMTNPCHDTRQDWFSVATQNPAQPGSFQSFLQVAGPFPTFASAMADADTRKMNVPGFRRACCLDWSVLQNINTGALSVARITPTGGVPFGFRLFDGRPQCCEDAFNEAGIPVGTVRDCRNLQLGAPLTLPTVTVPAGSTVTLFPSGVWVPFGTSSPPAPPPTGPLTGSSLTGTTLTYYPATTPAQCQADCQANPNCKGYNWIAAGTYQAGDPAMCYLLSAVTGSTPAPGHIAVSKSGGRFTNPPPQPIPAPGRPLVPGPRGPGSPPPTDGGLVLTKTDVSPPKEVVGGEVGNLKSHYTSTSTSLNHDFNGTYPDGKFIRSVHTHLEFAMTCSGGCGVLHPGDTVTVSVTGTESRNPSRDHDAPPGGLSGDVSAEGFQKVSGQSCNVGTSFSDGYHSVCHTEFVFKVSSNDRARIRFGTYELSAAVYTWEKRR